MVKLKLLMKKATSMITKGRFRKTVSTALSGGILRPWARPGSFFDCQGRGKYRPDSYHSEYQPGALQAACTFKPNAEARMPASTVVTAAPRI